MSLPQSYFDQLYVKDDDPWSFRTRAYELRKRDITVAALPERWYGSVFEPGCSIGLLTASLAQRSGRVLAMDISVEALQRINAGLPANVELRQGAIPQDWPDGTFDLVVLSEVAYYLDTAACRRAAELACGSARDLIAVHWRHPVEDYPLGGDEVHEVIRGVAEARGLSLLVNHVEEDFRLDVWSCDRRSVAARSGLLPAAD